MYRDEFLRGTTLIIAKQPLTDFITEITRSMLLASQDCSRVIFAPIRPSISTNHRLSITPHTSYSTLSLHLSN